MSILLETNFGGDLVIDLDLKGSPALCRNLLKLVKARCYTNVLIYNVQPNRFCQLGDPRGDGSGGACIYGYLDANDATAQKTSSGNAKNITCDVTKSQKRFLKSQGRSLTAAERQQKGRVVAVEMNGIKDTIGSQFLITLAQGPDHALDGLTTISNTTNTDSEQSASSFLSLGVVAEDDNDVLEKIRESYCDSNSRPYADIRIVRALVIHDPFEDPPGFQALLHQRGVHLENENGNVTASPEYERPPEETAERRIQVNEVDVDEDEEVDAEKAAQREEEMRQKEDKSRAVVLEMLGDLPSAEIKAPEDVLFVCKLNPVTDDEDLELIFSRFDPTVKAEIIRDPDTGASLQYAFVEFSSKKQCVEAYFKMNNALVDDRRIKVDFSQSVAKVWDKYAQRMKGAPQKRLQPLHQQQQGQSYGGREQGPRRQHPGGDARRGGRGGLMQRGGSQQNHHRRVSQENSRGNGDFSEHRHRNIESEVRNSKKRGDARSMDNGKSQDYNGETRREDDPNETRLHSGIDHNKKDQGRRSRSYSAEKSRSRSNDRRSRSRSRSIDDRSDSRSQSRDRKRRKKEHRRRHKHRHRDGEDRHRHRDDDRHRRDRDDDSHHRRRQHRQHRHERERRERKSDRHHADRRHSRKHKKRHRRSRSDSRSRSRSEDPGVQSRS